MLDEGTRIALYEPDLPPPREVKAKRYHYYPCPLRPNEVPMPDHLFFHFFFEPAGHSRGKWMNRLPKKLKESMSSNGDEFPIGWGIHIIESPDYYVVLLTVLVGLIVSGVVAVAVAAVTKDVQSGFGVGSYFASVQAIWMAAMYVKWSQQ